ncbi:TetR/AcrR family transcriptional regulator [Nocardia wallacei]|uniref:TetR/AcrR family transcriptional regulator n=1 Tax=Nocardia wallacei TaxID=480035 RepID=UPI002458BEB6|nr:TetR/AcrR family transcriptional regulator C-terminal domain-containing protein [Nocardia wallacei]
MTDSEIGEPRTRRSRGRPRVPFDRIVTTALQIVDDEGAEALSMRTLAQRLDSGTAVLYRAVSGRGELVGHVVDWVFGEVDFDNDVADGNWQQACRSAAQAIFDTLGRHRGIAPLLVERVPTGPNALALRERFLAILLDSGFSPESASRAYAVLARYVLGFASQLRAQDTTADAEPARLTELYRRLDPAAYRATIAVADFLPAQTLEEEFRFGLDLIIDGLTRRRETR